MSFLIRARKTQAKKKKEIQCKTIYSIRIHLNAVIAAAAMSAARIFPSPSRVATKEVWSKSSLSYNHTQPNTNRIRKYMESRVAHTSATHAARRAHMHANPSRCRRRKTRQQHRGT